MAALDSLCTASARCSLPNECSEKYISSSSGSTVRLDSRAKFFGSAHRQKKVSVTSFPSPSVFRIRAEQAGSVATASPEVKEIEFLWKGAGSEVYLTGDFLNWVTKIPMLRNSDGLFTTKKALPPGKYTFKFIVDGMWVHSPDTPVVEDGAGGFNNILSIEEPKKPQPEAVSEPAPAPAAAPAAKVAGPVGKKVVGKVAGKKVVAKPIKDCMEEDIIPAILAFLKKENGVSDISLTFADDQLRGAFQKNGIPYTFWAYFPDGILEGARGFSLTTWGSPPSTVEPFIIDEKRITPELVVFWVTKRLFAQKLLSLN